MLFDFLIIVAGVSGILLLAEFVIYNSVELARHLGLSGSFIGLTILSIGTSVPELMSHIVGSIEIIRHPETLDAISALLMGTNIGSDIFQQNFILPIVGLLGTIVVVGARLHDVMIGLLGAAILAWIFCLGGLVSRIEGWALMLAYFGYLLYLLKRDRQLARFAQKTTANNRDAWLSLVLIVVCFVIMAVITERVVVASIDVVAQLPISASFFGIVFLGIATSLPELTTALVSMHKGERDISVAILLGSNVTNPLLGIGIGAAISTYTVPEVVVIYDLPLNIATALLLYWLLFGRDGLSKAGATSLLVLFFVYLFVRVLFFPEDLLASM